MTCSDVPTTLAISGFVRPCHTRVAILTSVEFSCSRGDMVHLLLFKDGGGENDALTALLDARAKKKRAEMLLYSAWTDVEFCGNVFVAATLHQQVQHLPIAVCDFDLIEVKHDSL